MLGQKSSGAASFFGKAFMAGSAVRSSYPHCGSTSQLYTRPKSRRRSFVSLSLLGVDDLSLEPYGIGGRNAEGANEKAGIGDPFSAVCQYAPRTVP